MHFARGTPCTLIRPTGEVLQGQPSGKVQEGVQRCALRAIMALSQQRDMHEALTEAGIPDLLQVWPLRCAFCCMLNAVAIHVESTPRTIQTVGWPQC